MESGQDYQIWENRWKALDETMKALAETYESPDFPRHETCYHLVARLRAFATRQFYFFFYGFNHKNGSLKKAFGLPTFQLRESEVFQPEYIYRATLDQVAHDIEVIQRAANARMPGSSRTMRDTLEIADDFALRCLEPAIDAGLVKAETTVLTYFQKSASIRIIPYASVALIGIPFTSARFPLSDESTIALVEYNFVARDLLATPHEVGHYVFRNGMYQGESVYKELNARIEEARNEKPKQYGTQEAPNNWGVAKNWAEEIFADVYGCLSGGPATAASSQDLALQYYSKAEFTLDDGEHPAPILRPRIYAKVVNQKGNGDLASNLLERWKGRLKDRPAAKEEITPKRSVKGGKAIKISEAISRESVNSTAKETSGTRSQDNQTAISSKIEDGLRINQGLPVDFVIAKVLEILKIGTSVQAKGPISNLYSGFKDKLPKELAPVDLEGLWEEWIKEENFFPPNGLPGPGPIDSGNEQDLEEKPDGKWIHVALAAGWTTKIGNHEGG